MRCVRHAYIYELESTALASAGITTAGRGRPIALAAASGVLGTPRARIIRDSFREYFAILPYFNLPGLALELREAWTIASETLLNNNSVNKVGYIFQCY